MRGPVINRTSAIAVTGSTSVSPALIALVRHSCSVAGRGVVSNSAAYDRTPMTSAAGWRSQSTATRSARPVSTRSVGNSHRLGSRSVLRRRSPRGKVATTLGAADEGRQQVPSLRVQPVAGVGEFTTAIPDLSAQQRVFPAAARVGILGEPDHDDQVDIQPDRGRNRANEDTLTEPADPGQRGLEFQLQQVGQPLPARRDAEGVQARESLQDPVDRRRGVLLLGRQTAQIGCLAVDVVE